MSGSSASDLIILRRAWRPGAVSMQRRSERGHCERCGPGYDGCSMETSYSDANDLRRCSVLGSRLGLAALVGFAGVHERQLFEQPGQIRREAIRQRRRSPP